MEIYTPESRIIKVTKLINISRYYLSLERIKLSYVQQRIEVNLKTIYAPMGIEGAKMFAEWNFNTYKN